MQTLHKKDQTKPVIKLAAMAALGLMIFGCGQKGDLRLPEQPEETEQTPTKASSNASPKSSVQIMRVSKESL